MGQGVQVRGEGGKLVGEGVQVFGFALFFTLFYFSFPKFGGTYLHPSLDANILLQCNQSSTRSMCIYLETILEVVPGCYYSSFLLFALSFLVAISL